MVPKNMWIPHGMTTDDGLGGPIHVGWPFLGAKNMLRGSDYVLSLYK